MDKVVTTSMVEAGESIVILAKQIQFQLDIISEEWDTQGNGCSEPLPNDTDIIFNKLVGLRSMAEKFSNNLR